MSFVRPLSLAARDAIENLPMDFTSARSMAQRQQVLEAFAQLDFIYQGSQRPKLFQLFYDRKDFFVNVESDATRCPAAGHRRPPIPAIPMVQRPPPSIDPRQRIFVRLFGSLLTRTQYIVIDLTIPCIILRIFNKDDQDFFPMDLSYVLARTSSREGSRPILERASDLCPMDHNHRPEALLNLAAAKFVSCQADGRHLDLDIPINLFQDALDLCPIDHPDITQLHPTIALQSHFETGISNGCGWSKVLDVCHANSHIYRAGACQPKSYPTFAFALSQRPLHQKC
ncbi:hypothetical protein DFJ58DRAFT_736713 [Suillus subalutaceus]|uniref:uncharacterized protein n=1 Tax=Suillus subalutaceus TaxID=48586 RepID=UPI001B885167|nr:uncharacterized protein DFJ58DRAFT_736713 [Suillus subalutaceus]KAG1831179.1 hypothetical protein DFJ58DRAFT_736713 [Suillus subalutaceus]